ncbi:MAG TPA: ABC transporter ATP-binding protein [Pelolinea sp.]|nr:ABC transporter ATP-binding protein [Pelolinea sp.]
MNNAVLEIRDIVKRYQDQVLLNHISFSIQPKETICLLGPSGGGKSTLLRIIAGLEPPESGQIAWNGKNITVLPPHQRNFGLMFQDYALFPQMNVKENVAFGLHMKKVDSAKIEKIVSESLGMVRMAEFGDRRVTDLSGGEQQRVALARALAPQPKLLMLDEPLGALDRTLRDHLLAELRLLLRQIDIPVIYVTHDQQEAFTIADRLLILHGGQILQSGTPSNVYSYPATPWLAEFFGFDNQMIGEVISASPLTIKTQLGNLRCLCAKNKVVPGENVILVVKPDGARINSEMDFPNQLLGKVGDSVFGGDHYKTMIHFNNGIDFKFDLDNLFSLNEEVYLSINPESILCFGKTQ